MVKSELIQKLANLYPAIFRRDIERIVNIIFSEITHALCRGKNIEIRGFGTYKITTRRARIGRNPKNSKSIQIPSKKAIKWKMSKALHSRLNKNFTENKKSATY